MKAGAARSGAALLCGAVLAVCSACAGAPSAAPAASSAGDACRELQAQLQAAVAPGQSLSELQAAGVRPRSPLRFLPGAVPRSAQPPSGAAVRMLIAADGSVVPGSPATVGSVGDPQLARAVEAAALSMSFDVDPAARAAAPIAFTTTFATCPRP